MLGVAALLCVHIDIEISYRSIEFILQLKVFVFFFYVILQTMNNLHAESIRKPKKSFEFVSVCVLKIKY